MKVEIITIGDEILSGDIVNTNVVFLSEALWLQGLIVDYQSAVRDDPNTIRQALLLAARRADVVIVTGGLGPTGDDFTIEIAAKTFHKKLVQNKSKQALIPSGAKVYLNPVGTAPGIGLKFKGVSFYFLPGVPKEMKALFGKNILPEILAKKKGKKRKRGAQIFGRGDFFFKRKGWESHLWRRGRKPGIGSWFSFKFSEKNTECGRIVHGRAYC